MPYLPSPTPLASVAVSPSIERLLRLATRVGKISMLLSGPSFGRDSKLFRLWRSALIRYLTVICACPVDKSTELLAQIDFTSHTASVTAGPAPHAPPQNFHLVPKIFISGWTAELPLDLPHNTTQSTPSKSSTRCLSESSTPTRYVTQ